MQASNIMNISNRDAEEDLCHPLCLNRMSMVIYDRPIVPYGTGRIRCDSTLLFNEVNNE